MILSKNEINNIFNKSLKTTTILSKKITSKINGIITLSNGRCFEYRLPNYLIPNLLGFNLEYIKKLDLFDPMSDFNLFRQFLTSKEGIIYGIEKGLIDLNELFDEQIIIK